MKKQVFDQPNNYTHESSSRITRRDAVRLLSSASLGLCIAAPVYSLPVPVSATDATPPLSRGSPKSTERLALIERFKKTSEGLQNKFEAHIHKSDWMMP